LLKILNSVVSTLQLGVAYGFARQLLPAGKRKWAVFLLLILPIQWTVSTDYSHHLFSSFYLFAGTWCVWEIIHGPPATSRKALLSLVAGLCLTLMALQRGIHLIAIGTWTAMIVAELLGPRAFRRNVSSVVFAWLLPLLAVLTTARTFDRWLMSHDEHQLNSMLPAFVARGWCPETGGEYCGRYEQIDRATPPTERNRTMWRLVFSQIRRNPLDVCIRLPILKTAKLFLVGYASNIEESFAMNGSGLLPFFRGMRLVAAPLFLVFSCLGCLLLSTLGVEVQRKWLCSVRLRLGNGLASRWEE
jgi:hypothetical protein